MDYITLATPPAPASFGTKVTQLAFMSRFTATERKAIKAACSTNPDVDDVWSLMTAATYIDLALPMTINGVALLVAAVPALTAARSAAVLALPVTNPLELPGSVRLTYGLPEIPT